MITAPSSISAVATGTPPMTKVDFVVSAYDEVDGSVAVTCTPPSGTSYAVGTHTARCTAADSQDQTSSSSISIKVTGESLGPPHTPSKYDLRGGALVRLHFNAAGTDTPAKSFTATAGPVVNFGNKKAVLVASHSINVDSTLEFARMTLVNPHENLLAGHPAVGSAVLASTGVSSGSTISSDAALVLVDGSSITPRASEIKTRNTVTRLGGFGGSFDPAVKTAELVGAYTKSAGSIISTNASLLPPDSAFYTGQVIASYRAVKGDSGAPVVHTTSGGVTKLLGLHAATVSTFRDVPTGAAVFQGASTYTGNSNTSFSVFSPWENIQRDLRIPSQPQPGLSSQSQ